VHQVPQLQAVQGPAAACSASSCSHIQADQLLVVLQAAQVRTTCAQQQQVQTKREDL
jgi:hypothetical protein